MLFEEFTDPIMPERLLDEGFDAPHGGGVVEVGQGVRRDDGARGDAQAGELGRAGEAHALDPSPPRAGNEAAGEVRLSTPLSRARPGPDAIEVCLVTWLVEAFWQSCGHAVPFASFARMY